MTPENYRLIHVACALLLFLGLGGALFVSGDQKPSKLAMSLHGIALLAMLIAGVGYWHKQGLAWEHWITAKIGCWLFVGMVPLLVKKRVIARGLGVLLVVVVGATAVWLAQTKPF